MFNNIGPSELLIVALILLVLFGSKRLGELAGQLGQAKKEIKKAKGEYEKALSGQLEDEEDNEKKEEGYNKEKPESKEVGN